MGTSQGPKRVALLAGAIAIGAATALTGISPALAAPVDVAGGSLDWGFKASFRAYVSTGNGNPPIALSNGATRNTDGTFDFAAKTGTYDASAGTANVKYQGTVVFSYPSHFFEITLANPTLVVDGDGTGSLLADVKLVNGGVTQTDLQQAEVATVATTAPAVTDGAVSFSNLASTLTAAGASAFTGFYSAGATLDPITASASASKTTEPTDPTDPTDPTGPTDPTEPTDPEPGNGSASQKIKAAVSGGALTLASSGSDVALSAATPGQTAAGALNAVTVSDLRGTNSGWDLVGQVTDFASTGGGKIPAANLGWTPTASVVDSTLVDAAGVSNKVTAGNPIAPGTGLGSSRTLCSAETGSSLGSASCGAGLELGIPESSAAGEYSAVLTLTLA
ncbi:HtaA domain-containing protein [Actinoplanes sp. DH11]|uniref:HtaA domain-containing protein n=1 Tax=Actinoplanes sp. DH11 TaxID=2857011 RepID=UPI001E59D7AA|nr:HtaA domain-containing protein [Actinoplanes sp. DH11]